jgi:predicted metal-dependent peptidase
LEARPIYACSDNHHHHHDHHQIASRVRIQKARTTLLLDHPFFGTLLFRLGAKPSRAIATMATDGICLFYNPEFAETLNAAELAGVLAHEVMHPALQHHTRRGDRNQARWNMACDYAINPLLLDAGLTLPKDVLIDSRFRGMSAERIYNLIENEENQDTSAGQPQEQGESAESAISERPNEKSKTDEARDEPQAPTTPGRCRTGSRCAGAGAGDGTVNFRAGS